ncbi:MAG: methylenetetrahydrofolate--tRNA-(uracil(54)-C(5))-methyltransferase (FADH(2)-oxidizing) TrmFO [Candidatus Eisenbacteria bacterium]
MSRSAPRVVVIGGGLAGSEAAWQAARLGADVTLFEMRPRKMTEAHTTGNLAELVCSNSFKSDSISNANGLLKLELRMLGSMLMDVAAEARVPAGSALCVDRSLFGSGVTRSIESSGRVTLLREEAVTLTDDAVNVLAPGPLASAAVSRVLETIVGTRNLFFYDAVSPIIETESIDLSRMYRSARYGKGDSTYINLPLDRQQYMDFLNGLRQAELVPKRDFEDVRFFSGCMPIEELAGMGDETLAHGCMKPVGLVDPRTGRIPHAVVQLRPENLEGSLHGMVGFQTRLRHGEQKRVFRLLPGLENARFARLGSIHRNTYVNAPVTLGPTLEHLQLENVVFAGQITGAEGYMAAIATGLLAGINAARKAFKIPCVVPPAETMLGGLVRYVSVAPSRSFQPMNPNFGLLPRLGPRMRDKQRRNLLLSERSAVVLKAWIDETGIAKTLDGAVDYSGVLP